jgi:hypothetical protein
MIGHDRRVFFLLSRGRGASYAWRQHSGLFEFPLIYLLLVVVAVSGLVSVCFWSQCCVFYSMFFRLNNSCILTSSRYFQPGKIQ